MFTEESIARDFPSLNGQTYLNTAAESIPPLTVRNALDEYFADKSLGMDGRERHFARKDATQQSAADLLGLTAEEVAFCSCSAEAFNLLATALNLREGDQVILNDLDFPSGSSPWIAAREKLDVALWHARSGALLLEDLNSLLNSRTRLIQVSLVSFYNGWRLPWPDFIQLVRERAPDAIVSVDLTQALGRCEIDCPGADIFISSTHKWLLGIHGGCIVGVPKSSADRLTTAAGGWYHLENAFAPDRFERAVIKPGAASFAVGMPSFAPIYALHAGVNYLIEMSIAKIASYADRLTRSAYDGLLSCGIQPMAPRAETCASGIVAFRHPQSERIMKALRKERIHIMHQAGRMRLSVHGYNLEQDIDRFTDVVRKVI